MTKLFIPYIMGNKDLIENATLLSENGADIIEIGVPFSDPVADGPVIMEAGQQAIKQGITIDYIFNQLEKHGDQIKCNYVLMTYIILFVIMENKRFLKNVEILVSTA